jgi:hypothetical protein
VREYGFELRICARLERRFEGVVARQVGTATGGERVMDAVVVTPGPEFADRAAITSETIPPPVLEAEAGLTWTPITDTFEGPPGRARRLAEQGVEAGFLERARRGGSEVIRQVARYPDWVGEIGGVENKPDLGRPGDLATQLRKDVSLGLLDWVVVATESYVTGAHLNRIPEAVGVWRVTPNSSANPNPDPDSNTDTDTGSDSEPESQSVRSIEVVQEPEPLDPESPGLQVEARHPGRTDLRPVSAAEKTRQRRRIAERAYGKGWRPGLPACTSARAGREAGSECLPECAWKGRLVNPAAECGPDCPGYEPADPPESDPESERARNTAWVADPEGRTRRQAGLDRWSGGE